MLQKKYIDLTHTLSPKIPSWNGSCGFEQSVVLDYEQCASDTKFRVQRIAMHAGIGTHMDAPAHCIKGGLTIADLPLDRLIAPCIMINVSEQSHERYSIIPADLLKFENMHGIIASNSLVIFVTGWSAFWDQPEKYRNNHIFPSIAKETAELLIERDIIGLGIDTLSPDRPEDGFVVHQIILGAGKYIVENVANAAQLPPVGSYSFVLPLKTEGGTEAPVRMIGII